MVRDGGVSKAVLNEVKPVIIICKTKVFVQTIFKIQDGYVLLKNFAVGFDLEF